MHTSLHAFNSSLKKKLSELAYPQCLRAGEKLASLTFILLMPACILQLILCVWNCIYHGTRKSGMQYALTCRIVMIDASNRSEEAPYIAQQVTSSKVVRQISSTLSKAVLKLSVKISLRQVKDHWMNWRSKLAQLELVGLLHPTLHIYKKCVKWMPDILTAPVWLD